MWVVTHVERAGGLLAGDAELLALDGPTERLFSEGAAPAWARDLIEVPDQVLGQAEVDRDPTGSAAGSQVRSVG